MVNTQANIGGKLRAAIDRVEWSFASAGAPYIPPNKSVPEESSISAAWRSGNFVVSRDTLDLGSARGGFLCESRPFDFEGERCVLTLLHLPDDESVELGLGPRPNQIGFSI